MRGDGRTVTAKVFALLSTFETGPSAFTLSQLAEHAHLPLPTAHRLANELLTWGALERDAQGRYVVGLRLWEVSQHAGRQLRETARPFLQDLFSLTQETAHLAIRDGRDALYIDRVYSSRRVPRASRVGGRLPLHATAVGKVLLAYEEDWFRDAFLAQHLEASTHQTHVHPDRLAAELEQVRRQGHATTYEEVRAGSCSIAVPVGRGPGGAAVGLVMLSTQAGQMMRHLPALTGVARRIDAAVRRGPAGVATYRARPAQRR